VIAYAANGNTVPLILFQEVLIASIGLLAIPKNIEIHIEDLFGTTKLLPETTGRNLEENKDTSVLIITHYSRILDLIRPDFVHQMMEGKLICTGDITLAKEIEKEGYHGVNEIDKKVEHE